MFRLNFECNGWDELELCSSKITEFDTLNAFSDCHDYFYDGKTIEINMKIGIYEGCENSHICILHSSPLNTITPATSLTGVK